MAACPHCGAQHSAEHRFCPSSGRLIPEQLLSPGTVIEGKYEIGSMLGVGGMGAVFAARHLLLDKRVAIKVTLPGSEDVNAELSARMVREARAASAVEHPHIAHVLDLGWVAEGSLFVVMEYLEGQTLAELLESEGRLPLPRAATLIGQALEGLEAVHRKDILHRDLKPENFMIVRDEDGAEQIKILDFGIAKPLHADPALQLTSPGLLVGTPHFMAPEAMLRPEALDQRADLYAVGVVLYRVLTGSLPYPQDTLNALIAAQQRGVIVPPSQLAPELPRALDALVLRTLARRPEERFPDARAFRAALEPFAQGKAPAQPGLPAPVPAPVPAFSSLDDVELVSLDEARSSAPAPRPAPRSVAQPAEPPPAAETLMPAIEEEELVLEHGREATPRTCSSGTAAAAARAPAREGPRQADPPPPSTMYASPYGQALKKRQHCGRWLLVLLGLGVGSFALWRMREQRVGVPARVEEPVSQVRILIAATPLSAEIIVDDKPQASSVVLLPRSSRPVRIMAYAPGYLSRTETVIPEEDQHVNLTLQRELVLPPRKAPRRYLHSSKRASTSR